MLFRSEDPYAQIQQRSILLLMEESIISMASVFGQLHPCRISVPYIVNSLDGLGYYSERVSSLGLIVIVDSIKEENDFCELSRKFELSNPTTHE